jgi:hypothetical protein
MTPANPSSTPHAYSGGSQATTTPNMIPTTSTSRSEHVFELLKASHPQIQKSKTFGQMRDS